MKRVSLIIFSFIAFSLFSVSLLAQTAYAQDTITCPDGSQISVSSGAAGAGVNELCQASDSCERNNLFAFPTWYEYLEVGLKGNDPCAILGPTAEVDCTLELDEGCNLDYIAVSGRVGLAIIEIMLRLASIVSVGFVAYGGFKYIISQGEPDNAKSARKTIINALIGLVITMIATGSVMFIASQFS
jgi:hypothetical protein